MCSLSVPYHNGSEGVKSGLIVLFLFLIQATAAQTNITGSVFSYDEKNDPFPIPGVVIRWVDGEEETISDSEGQFSIRFISSGEPLVFIKEGFKTDTLQVSRFNLGKIWLHQEIELEEVTITNRETPLKRSLFSPANAIIVDSDEMLKAACCNLSESFDTNPSIDVNITDGLTGIKQIELLGLNSPYIQFTQENLPSVRGLSQVYGLSLIPGPWVESIQISKGSGSVINGFESISGQINTELQKPFSDIPLFVNVFGNQFERFEANARINHILNKELATGLYLHGDLQSGTNDMNGDGFLDLPKGRQINLLNRWQYQNDRSGIVSFFSLHFIDDTKRGGQTDFNFEAPDQDLFWGNEIATRRWNANFKTGYVFPDKPYQSIGIQASYSDHHQDSFFGRRNYDSQQNTWYTNLILSTIIGSTKHKIIFGLNYTNDALIESFDGNDFRRDDKSLGVYSEYTFNDLERWSIVLGLRGDFHNQLGNFISPRMHLRYAAWEKGVFRASFGRGIRAPNIIAENQQVFGSARNIQIEPNQGNFYGLKPEVAWNFGLSFQQKLYLYNRVLNLNAEYFNTSFTQQVVADWEDPGNLRFYNLEGKSYSEILQFDLDYEIIPYLFFRATYKIFNVAMNYRDQGLLRRPYLPKNRFFMNLSYETKQYKMGNNWKFDLTYNRLGSQRLPSTTSNPEMYRREAYSGSITTLNTQVTKSFSKKFEWYIGAENLTDLTQQDPIIAPDDPFGPYFDSTIVYAPIAGRTIYTGFRFKVM